MKAKYLPTTAEGKLIHVVEECAEVTKAACKIQRFGWHNHHPDDINKTPNIYKLFDELLDLEHSIKRLKASMEFLK